jgi:hypothetical protein
VAALVDAALVAELTVVDGRGRPVSYPLIPLYDGARIYMTSAALFSKKLRHIKANPKVSVAFTETGAGADALAIAFAKAFTEAGAGLDTLTIGQVLASPLTDVAAGEPHGAWAAGEIHGTGYASKEPRGGYASGDPGGDGDLFGRRLQPVDCAWGFSGTWSFMVSLIRSSMMSILPSRAWIISLVIWLSLRSC